MRKLVVLMLVLGLASLANAGLVYSVNGTQYSGGTVTVAAGPVTIAVVNTTAFSGDPDFGGIIATGGTTGFTGSTVYSANLAGSWSVIPLGYLLPADSGAPYAGYIDAVSKDNAVLGTTAAGAIFDFTLAKGSTNVVVQLLDSNFGASGQSLTLNTIPEPATLAILGLGGLLLRRKK